MRRFSALFVLFMLVVSIAIADGIDLMTMTSEELYDLRREIDVELARRQEVVVLDDGRNRLVYKGYHITRDTISIEFEYTNTSSSMQNFYSGTILDFYQDGIKMQHSIEIYGSSTVLNLRPGYSCTLYQERRLNNTISPIEMVCGNVTTIIDIVQ